MIQVAPTSKRPPLLAFAVVAIIALLVGMSVRSGPVTSVATGTSEPTTNAGPSGTGAAAASAGSTPTPAHTLPVPTLDPCALPARLPTPGRQAAAPDVSNGDLALVFASHLYARTPYGLVVRDVLDNQWSMGLWFVAPRTNQAQLLLAPTDGMVLPLALSPTGDRVAVWWTPQRQTRLQAACAGAIYLVFTASGRTELVKSGDWDIANVEGEDDGDDPRSNWQDPFTGTRYDLPEAAFSSDGQFLALIEGHQIDIYASGLSDPVAHHSGECTEWAWSAVGAVFVAGCDGMTTAWWVKREDGYQQVSIALPQPPFGIKYPGWEVSHGQAIGITGDGGVRVTRFYGFATGCEDVDCFIPPTTYALTTINPATGAATHQTTDVNFIVAYESLDPVRFSADASWVHVALADDRGAAVSRIGSGALQPPKLLGSYPLGTFAGVSIDGSLLFGWRVEERVVVASLDSAGTARDIATIGRPEGAISENPVIATLGLAVAAPPS